MLHYSRLTLGGVHSGIPVVVATPVTEILTAITTQMALMLHYSKKILAGASSAIPARFAPLIPGVHHIHKIRNLLLTIKAPPLNCQWLLILDERHNILYVLISSKNFTILQMCCTRPTCPNTQQYILNLKVDCYSIGKILILYFKISNFNSNRSFLLDRN